MQGLAPGEKAHQLKPLLASLSRRTVERVAADSASPDWIAQAFATYRVEKWGWQGLVHQAQSQPGYGKKWKRVAALRILHHAGYPNLLALLEQALAQDDREVLGTAVTLLGQIPDVRAAGLLVDALERGRYPASHVASRLDHFPLPLPDLLRPLLRSPQPIVRFWGATLLSRYPESAGLDAELEALAGDADPRVRKAAVKTLGRVGGGRAPSAALRLLDDPVWYVRAHAARALADLGRSDLAERVAALLAAREWWVRFAAKESLLAMGEDAIGTLIQHLDHPDPFARNGAAEVLQNMGWLDRCLAREVGADPAPENRETLRKALAAGGARLVESLVARIPNSSSLELESWVAELGLERAGTG
jgi:HEAT repeat protein